MPVFCNDGGMVRCIAIGLLVCFSCFAAPVDVEQRAAHLRTVLRQADDAYYNRGEPIMADETYDVLREQYEQLVSDYPDLPALSKVGAAVAESRLRVDHTRPVLSLKKAYTNEEVEAFLEECGREHIYCVEPKIDGLTVVLRYRKGRLEQAITRGDGHSGMDVTAQIMVSDCVPTVLKEAPEVLEVRGEVFFTFAAFDALNVRRLAAGQEPLKSPRSGAAGTLRLLDLSEVAQRGIELRIFEMIVPDTEPTTHINALAKLWSRGLPTIESHAVPGSEVMRTLAELNKKRTAYPFPTDGVVIKLDDRALYENMGSTERFPRGALARKYRAVPVVTKLLSIEWRWGDTGRITPVAHFEPVVVDGATLQYASLHSLDHLRALDLMLNDRIQVIRAGGSVPEIIGLSPDPRTGEEIPIPDPEGD